MKKKYYIPSIASKDITLRCAIMSGDSADSTDPDNNNPMSNDAPARKLYV